MNYEMPFVHSEKRGKPIWSIFVIIPILIMFFAKTIGTPLLVIVPGFIFYFVIYCMYGYILKRDKLVLYFPLLIYLSGFVIFHFSWGNTFIDPIVLSIPSENIILAVLISTLAILMVFLGTKSAVSPSTYITNMVNIEEIPIYYSVGLICLSFGALIEIWAVRNHLIGFSIGAYGLDVSVLSNPLMTLVLAVQSIFNIGFVTMLIQFLEEKKNNTWGKLLQRRFLIIAIFILSFIFDLVIRFQSAARATMLMGFLPILVVLFIYGYKKFIGVAIILGVILYIFLIFPLVSNIRSDQVYYDTMKAGNIFLPQFSYFVDVYQQKDKNTLDALSRLNQFGLLSFSIDRVEHGLPVLMGESYLYAFNTLVPRFINSQRVDRKISYDSYTGYYVGGTSYDNWGLHTEAYLNFGILGVIFIMFFTGYVWQRAYLLIFNYEKPIGPAIAIGVLLPTIFRAAESDFQMTIISTFRTIIFLLIIVKCIVLVWKMVIFKR